MEDDAITVRDPPSSRADRATAWPEIVALVSAITKVAKDNPCAMRYEKAVKLFKRWRRKRAILAAESEAEPVAPEPTQVKSVKRVRRPSTMGKTMAEQAYLAEAAMRAKDGSGR